MQRSRVPSQPFTPVFVFGVHHSGTTILYQMLAYHPCVTWFSQFSLRGGQIPGRSRRPGADRLDQVLRRHHQGWRKESKGLRRFVVPRPGEETPIWEYLLQDPATDAGRVRSSLLTFSKRHGGKRMVAKWPTFSWFLDPLQAAFPRASFVHIVRDGRPVALSLRSKRVRTKSVRTKRGLIELSEEELDQDRILHAAAREWVDGLERVIAAPEIDLLEVRYEDLCEDVHGVLGSILRHARLDAEAFPFDRFPRRLSNTNARWIEEASSRELEEVSEIQRDLLTRYRYPLAPDPARVTSLIEQRATPSR